MKICAGMIKGVQENGVTAFKGIPYAENPFIESRRFMAPQPVRQWDGTLDTASYRPMPQPGRGNAAITEEAGPLTLNVWTPDVSAKGLPVIVWIPGGAFMRCNASEQAYNGASFAANGVVFVSIDYRVGVDGFMQIKGAPANRGILDQLAALEWVQENIEFFGGDPQKVTVAGQSAGAGCIAILLGLPQADSLFRQAILQSPPMQWMSLEEAESVAAVLAGNLSTEPDIAGFGSVPPGSLMAAQGALAGQISDNPDWGRLAWGGTAFLPVVDGKFLQSPPMEMLAAAQSAMNRRVIVGSTDEESRLYLVSGGEIGRITEIRVESLLKYLGFNSSDVQQAYGPAPAGDFYAKLMSDYTFRMPALKIAEMMCANKNTWYYNFSWRSPAFNNMLGAAHFVDVPFSFNTLDSEQAKLFAGENPPETLAQAMHGAWVSFAKTGSPDWPAYDSDRRMAMRFDADSNVVSDPERDIRALWEGFEF